MFRRTLIATLVLVGLLAVIFVRISFGVSLMNLNADSKSIGIMPVSKVDLHTPEQQSSSEPILPLSEPFAPADENNSFPEDEIPLKLPPEVQEAIDTFLDKNNTSVIREKAGRELQISAAKYQDNQRVLSAIIEAFGKVFTDHEEGDNFLLYLIHDTLSQIASRNPAPEIAAQIADIYLKEFLFAQRGNFPYSFFDVLVELNPNLPSDYRENVLLKKLTEYVNSFSDFRSSEVYHYYEAFSLIAEAATTPEAKKFVAKQLNLNEKQKEILERFDILVMTALFPDEERKEKALSRTSSVLNSLPTQMLSAVSYILITDDKSRGGTLPHGFILSFSEGLVIDVINDDKFEPIDYFIYGLYHEIGHLVQKSLPVQQWERFKALFDISTDTKNDFADPYGSAPGGLEDYATIWSAWTTNFESLLQKAVYQGRSILLQKTLLAIEPLTFRGEDGQEYVYAYKLDPKGNITSYERLIMRDERGRIVGIDINGDGVITGENEDFRAKLGLPPQTDQEQKEASQYKIDFSNFDFLQFQSTLSGRRPTFGIERERNNSLERLVW